MKKLTKMFTAAATAALLAAPSAQAQVTFTGSTTGCFDAVGCPQISTVLGGLTFNQGFFNGTTDANGLLPIGGVGNNFGTLTLLSTPNFNYNGHSFSLFVTFTAPTPSGGPTQYNATLSGNVTTNGNGVFVQFNPNTRLLNFQGGLVATLMLNPVSVNAGDPAAQITGVIIAAPEPSTYVLMAGGLASLGMMGYRRRRTNV